MLYRPWTTQPASAAGPACLQLFGSKPGDGPPRTGHRLWLEPSQESSVNKASFNSVKGELMKMNCFLFTLVIFVSLSLRNKNLIFLLVPKRTFSYLLVSSRGKSEVRIGSASEQHSWSCQGLNVLLEDTPAGCKPASEWLEGLCCQPLLRSLY